MQDTSLIRDFRDWARGRLAGALALTLAGALVEGMSLVLLLPLIAIVLGTDLGGTTSTFGEAIGKILPEDQTSALAVVLLAFSCLLVVRMIVIQWREKVLARLEQDFVADMRLRFFGTIAHAPWGEAARLGHGRVGHALSRDIDRASAAVRAVLSGAAALALLCVQVSLAFWLAPTVAALVLALGAIVFMALAPIRARASRTGRSITAEDFLIFSNVGRFLRGLKSAKAHGLEDGYLTSFAEANRAYADRLVEMRRDMSMARDALQSAAALLALIAVFVGHAWAGIAPEALIVVLLLMIRLAPPLQGLQSSIQSLHYGSAAYESAKVEIAGRLTKSAPLPGAAPWPSAPGFRLESAGRDGEDGRRLLDGIDAEVPAGQITAIAGASGSGKSTLLDLIIGLDPPDRGRVLIDGAPMDPSAHAGLAQAMAYVGQDDVLLDSTLRENLTRGLGSVPDALIWEALDAVGAGEIVQRSATGLDDELRLDAQRFSGGERQRLRLARALLRTPRLLVLDEATSALDSEAEDIVLDTLRAALPEATILMVSHRPGIAARADHVIWLDGGRLA